jgi:hypothetical protein
MEREGYDVIYVWVPGQQIVKNVIQVINIVRIVTAMVSFYVRPVTVRQLSSAGIVTVMVRNKQS